MMSMMTKKEAMKERTIEDLWKEISILNFEPGSQYVAKPTFIVNPHDFYTIPMPFLYHLPHISKPGEPLKAEDLNVGMVVIFTSQNPDVNKYIKIDVDKNIRGVIQNIRNEKECDIYALDRGFIERDVSIDRIFYTATDGAAKIPSLVQHCQLEWCSPKGLTFTEEDIDTFLFYIGNEKLRVKIRGKSLDKLRVEVYNSNCDDIGTLMAYTNLTLLCGTSKDATLATNNSKPKLAYKHMELSVGEKFTVRVQSGPSLNAFYVTPMTAYNSYVKNRYDFNDYCKRLPEISSQDFVQGAPVGIRNDLNSYERGIILEVLDNKAKVKLVDWGTETIEHRNAFKALKTEFFLSEPVKAIYCSAVAGFAPWKNGLPVFLYKGYTFVIKVVKIGKGFEIPHVVEITRDGKN